jgi:hypothetical protein
MRWLPFVVLGACSFSPGTLPGVSGDDAAIEIDASMLVDGALADVPPDDMPPQPPAEFVRQIDIVDAKVTGAAHVNFPVMLSLAETWLKSSANGGNVKRDDGFDIYFSEDAAGTVRLAFEVEAYEPAAGTLLAWVKIPSLTPQTLFFIHYGSASITTSQAMPIDVWSGGYDLVAHMTTSSDATNLASAISAQTGTATTGRIGLALPFSAATDRIDYGSDAELDNLFVGGGTLEAWIRPASAGVSGLARIVSKENSGGWLFSVDNVNATSTIAFQHGGGSTSSGAWAAPNGTLAANVWHQVAIVYDKDSSANDPLIYVDGASVTVSELETPSGNMDSDASSTLVVGNRPALDRAFDGLLDEVRASRVSRSMSWMGTQYRNQSDPSTFYVIGNPL